MTINKTLTIEINFSCDTVGQSCFDQAFEDIISDIKSEIESVKYDEYRTTLNDFMSVDPYKEHRAELNISITEPKYLLTK